jgi:glycosyltransferase involved in cell wall biosynthesis
MHKLYGVTEKARLFERVTESARRAQYVVSVSEFSRTSFLDAFGLPEHSNIKAILIPVNPDRVSLLDKNEAKEFLGLEGKPVLLFCGVHLPIQRKGLDILLTTISEDEYLRNKCKLVVVTSKEAKVFADRFFTQQGLDGLTFVSLPRETLVKVYNAADVFVMPSRQEGIGLAYYEALLAGTPVVGFYKSVQELERELGIYIGEGFNAATEGPKELAEKIKKVLRMRVDRQALRKAVVEKLSWEVKFQEYDRIYRELVPNNPRFAYF